MTWYFLDTSALVKRYHVETGTDAIDRIFAEPQIQLVISRLALVEVTSALALKVRTGELQSTDYVVARKRFLGDIKSKRPTVVRLLVTHYGDAEKLVHTHSLTRRLRTLDALRLAVAKQMRNQGRTDVFVSADLALLAIAEMEGLKTFNPEAV